MGTTLKCNSCWSHIPPDAKCIVTRCAHLYCLQCAEGIVTSGRGCQQCGDPVSKKEVKVLQMAPAESRLIQTALLGQTPEAALHAAACSVRFFRDQQALSDSAREAEFARREEKIERKMNKLRTACEQQLSKIHGAYKTAKRKNDELQREHQLLRQDLQEMMSKYEHKSKQARHLQEMVAQVQQQHGGGGALRHHQGGGGRMGGGPGDTTTIPSSRQQQMVHTTVHRTQAVFDIMSPNTGNLVGGTFNTGGGAMQPPSGGGASRQLRMVTGGSGFDLSLGGGGGMGGRHNSIGVGNLLRSSPAMHGESPALLRGPMAIDGGSGGGMFDNNPGSAGGANRSLAAMAAGGRPVAGRIGNGGAGIALNSLLGQAGAAVGGVRHSSGPLFGGGGMSVGRGIRNTMMMSPSMNTA